MIRRTTRVVLLAVSLALVFAAAALAAKSNGGSTAGPSTIVLNQANPRLGDTITFTSSYPSTAKNPRIDVTCTQNGAMVYADAGAPNNAFVLGGYASVWTGVGGAASCVARLYDLTWKPNTPQQVTMYASTTFDAAG
jgi:hypothetical protein